jgi:mannose-6-phosphate isomerase-like protein (cupin superfamily)
MSLHPTNPYDPNDFDKSLFNVEKFVKRVEKPWGYELHLVPETAPYMLKIEHINAGARLSLQVHDVKVESWTLMKGEAKVQWENNQGELTETILELGVGYSTQVGQKHRLIGVSECDIIEASLPEGSTTWRLEDDYNRPHETEEQRKIERGEV